MGGVYAHGCIGRNEVEYYDAVGFGSSVFTLCVIYDLS
jgi:hypothetical protein